MIVEEILNELETVNRPVAKAIHKSSDSKSICIGFKAGMRLKEHKTNRPTTLLVLSGKIDYWENDEMTSLSQYDQHQIPVDIMHSVDAEEDSLILLMQG